MAVIGSGTMGGGIAQNFAQAGLSVRLVDINEQILERSMKQIDDNLSLFLEHGLLDEETYLVKARIKPFLSQNLSEATTGCDFVLEAVPEILKLKQALFGQLDALPGEIILGSNTSSFTISSITEGMDAPERVVGLHYFNPAHIMPLVEIHRGRKTTYEVIEVTQELMHRIGKIPILIRKEVPGFVVNRIQAAMAREAHDLIKQGVVTPEDLDMAAKGSYGFRLACSGPLETADMGGLDTILRACDHIFKELNNDPRPSSLLAEKVEKGELGVKSGKGWHDYSGQSRTEMIRERDKKLIRQLVLFNLLKKDKDEKTGP